GPELRLEVLAALVLDLDVVLLGPVRPRLLQEFGLGVDDGAVDGDGRGLAFAAASSASALGGSGRAASGQSHTGRAEKGERSEPAPALRKSHVISPLRVHVPGILPPQRPDSGTDSRPNLLGF